MRGTSNAGRRTLPGGRAAWGQPVLGFEHPSSSSHFSAALIPGPLRGQGSVVPRSSKPRDGRRAPRRAGSAPRALDPSHLPRSLAPRGLASWLVGLVLGGDLEIEFPADREAISHLAVAVGTLEERGRRCDMNVKAAVSLGKGFFIAYIICILLQ